MLTLGRGGKMAAAGAVVLLALYGLYTFGQERAKRCKAATEAYAARRAGISFDFPPVARIDDHVIRISGRFRNAAPESVSGISLLVTFSDCLGASCEEIGQQVISTHAAVVVPPGGVKDFSEQARIPGTITPRHDLRAVVGISGVDPGGVARSCY